MVEVTQNNDNKMQKQAEMQNGHEMQMRCNVGAVKLTQEHLSAAAPVAPEGALTGNQLAALTVKREKKLLSPSCSLKDKTRGCAVSHLPSELRAGHVKFHGSVKFLSLFPLRSETKRGESLLKRQRSSNPSEREVSWGGCGEASRGPAAHGHSSQGRRITKKLSRPHIVLATRPLRYISRSPINRLHCSGGSGPAGRVPIGPPQRDVAATGNRP